MTGRSEGEDYRKLVAEQAKGLAAHAYLALAHCEDLDDLVLPAAGRDPFDEIVDEAAVKAKRECERTKNVPPYRFFDEGREVSEIARADRERGAIKAAWPDEFNDGARCAFLQRVDGPREKGGYPLGFHHGPLARRNAWFAGFNLGRCDRLRLEEEAVGR
jgi:hypothetical protein